MEINDTTMAVIRAKKIIKMLTKTIVIREPRVKEIFEGALLENIYLVSLKHES